MARCLLCCLTAAMLAIPAAGAERLLRLDPATSEIRFTLDATMHEVHGSFKLAEGEIRFDPESGSIRGRVTADATSGDTANAKRDRKMHRKVLRSEEHPSIEFRPSGFSGRLDPEGESELQLRGTMSLKGREHPVELPVVATVEGERLRLRGSLAVPYVAWGLEDPSVFVLRVGKTVEVSLDLRGRLTIEESENPQD